MNNNREQEPTIRLSRDEFTARRRELNDHPEAVHASSRVDVVNPYGDVSTWVLDLFRVEGRVTALIQRFTADGGTRMVIPPEVTTAIARHQSSLVTKQRRKVARRVVADKRARGEQVGNPEALAAHRRKAKKKATR